MESANHIGEGAGGNWSGLELISLASEFTGRIESPNACSPQINETLSTLLIFLTRLFPILEARQHSTIGSYTSSTY